MRIKRILTFYDEVRSAAGRDVDPPLRKAAAVAVLDNPCAGRFERDLSALTKASEDIGRQICRLAIGLLTPEKPVSYGKAAIIGMHGEQEHGVAMLTTVFGNVMREAADGGKASPSERRRAPALMCRSRTRTRSMSAHRVGGPAENEIEGVGGLT